MSVTTDPAGSRLIRSGGPGYRGVDLVFSPFRSLDPGESEWLREVLLLRKVVTSAHASTWFLPGSLRGLIIRRRTDSLAYRCLVAPLTASRLVA